MSLYLHGGKYCRPPISRMGSKAGFSEVIAAALGLRGGIGADHFVWCESDPDVRALLRAYPDADMLRRIADIIRGWKDEEPRALWERLRVERKARNLQATHDVAETASWIYVHNVSHLQTPGPDGMRGFVHPEEGGRYGAGREETAARCHRLAEYASNEVASGFERVAEWAILSTWAYRKGEPESGFNPGVAVDRPSTETANAAYARHAGLEADLFRPAAGVSRWPPVAVLATLPDAAELSALLGTPGDLEGVVVYSDPDYRDTTGYLSTCREIIPDLALGWAAMGATVCVSEAVPVEELTAHGWHAIDITGGRRGQTRTFARVATESLTMNVEPKHRVATQVSMFGGTR